MSRRALDTDTAARWATGLFKDRNRTIYTLLIILALLFPSIADVSTGGSGNHLVSTAADAGVYVLLAMGLNIVVGFAGLLDLGYAAFFAIGAYTYALLASGQLSGSPLHHEFHLPFWLLLLVAMLVAATFGAILGAPTLRLRGDYLAIVTLGFGEIVPRIFKFLGAGSPIGNWTGGVNGISAIDPPKLPAFITGPWVGAPIKVVAPFDFSDSSWAPMDYYLLILVLVAVGIFAVLGPGVEDLVGLLARKPDLAVGGDEDLGVDLALGVDALAALAGQLTHADDLVHEDRFGGRVEAEHLIIVDCYQANVRNLRGSDHDRD